MTMPPARPAEAGSKPAQIMEAAGRLFLEHGYGAVSMDTVAKTANVSKATLYAHFRSKDELFAALIARECETYTQPMTGDDMHSLPVGEALREIARRFVTLVMSPKALAAYRVVIGESPRFPELARAFYDAGPAGSLARVAAFLAEADRSGKLSIPDPELAAEQFLGMLRSHLHLRQVLGIQDRLSDADVERVIEGAVSLMLRGYAPR